MLDNIVTEKSMAAMPIEILADAKVNNNNKHLSEDKLQDSATVVTKTNKTKTILNWLKNTTTNANNNNNININNIKANSVTSDNKEINLCNKQTRNDKLISRQETHTDISDNCTCPKVKTQNNTRSLKDLTSTNANSKNHKDDEGLREFRGVQTLKHFWNKRITANRDSALKNKSSKPQFTKSVSCLVNAINNTGEPPPFLNDSSPPPLSEKELLKARKLRALSLHDCSRDSIDFDEISLSDIDIQKHLEKDNFYKYKTAEQASKLRELSEHSSTQRKLSNSIVLPAKTERFDWLKRHDKFSRKKSIELTISPSTQLFMSSDKANTSATINRDIVINEHKMHTQQKETPATCLPTAIGQNINDVGNTNLSSEASTPTLTATNSPQHALSRRGATTRKDSIKTLTSANNISRDSSTTSLATSAKGHKTVVKRNSSARKYSFKTHTRSYHVPRKMHSNKDTISSGASLSGNSTNSLVAKLTQQFNEIIQKDKTLLEELKRKNGVIMTHKGHVYKVVDTSTLNRHPSPSGSRTSSRSQDINNSQTVGCSSDSSTVKKNIKKFESESRGLKPKVPLKSIKVLRTSNEVVLNKTAIAGTIQTTNKVPYKRGIECKTEIKPQTLQLPKTLEIVQEEAKTPVDSHDNKDNKKENKEQKANRLEESSLNSDISILLKNDDTQEYDKPKEIEDKTLVQRNNENNSKDNTKENDLIVKKGQENGPKQDNLFVVMPPRNDSVIYKSIHKNRKKNTEPLKVTTENTIDDKLELLNKSTTINQENVENFTKLQESDLNNDDKAKSNSLEVTSKQNNNQITTSTTGQQDKPRNLNLDIKTSKNTKSTEDTKYKSPEDIKTKIDNCKTPEDTKTILDNSVERCTSPEPLEEEDKRKRKHKYAKIYEKLRYFTPFSHSSKKLKPNASSSSSLDVATLEDVADSVPTSPNSTASNIDNLQLISSTATPYENSSIVKPGEYTPMSSPTSKKALEFKDIEYSVMLNPEAKLLDALEQVDKKLQNLNNDNNESFLESDEYGQPLKPNSSFLHQSSIKELTPTASTVIQAVNVTLVNAIEGEQMIMEQKEIQQKQHEETEQDTKMEIELPPPLLPPKKPIEEEPLYEPICVDEKVEIKTEKPYINSEEDIYQTVEEAKELYDHLNTLKPANIVINSLQELDGYEPIENPDDSMNTTKTSINDVNNPIVHFDGYEEYTPSVETITTTTTSTGARKVTDELPDLPKPKRILPKSPMPIRTAPKPPFPRQQSTEESLTSNCQEPPYYGTEENIYDTIKGSHCYESLQCVGNKLQSSPPLLRNKNMDTVSLTSNCYESISHFKRANIVGHNSGGSSNGSTLTISSENKTNSLYEDSLTSSLHYSSKRIYNINAHVETNKSTITDGNSINGGYGGSIGRTTDTSDEWTDVTDNENNEAESKPQFIM